MCSPEGERRAGNRGEQPGAPEEDPDNRGSGRPDKGSAGGNERACGPEGERCVGKAGRAENQQKMMSGW